METRFLREALFSGTGTNAFKLGTVLSLGWFWYRIAGCSVLYRGSSMWTIDFENTLAVGDIDASRISPPSYLRHDSGSTYFYVVRRINHCGYEEYTIAAAVKVAIGSEGNIAESKPNKIFTWRAVPVDGGKIQLTWFYCPLEQKTPPAFFKVYFDNATGQIDYDNPVDTITYEGRRFYSFKSDAMQQGEYLFAIRAEDAAGAENSSLARLRVQVQMLSNDTIEILSAKAV